jgi:hypothetical protein
MLVVDPAERLDLEGICMHAWLEDVDPGNHPLGSTRVRSCVTPPAEFAHGCASEVRCTPVAMVDTCRPEEQAQSRMCT